MKNHVMYLALHGFYIFNYVKFLLLKACNRVNGIVSTVDE